MCFISNFQKATIADLEKLNDMNEDGTAAFAALMVRCLHKIENAANVSVH